MKLKQKKTWNPLKKKKSNMLEYIFQDQLEIVNQSKL